MNKPIPVTLVQNQTLDSNGDIVFLLMCDNHFYNQNGKHVLTSDSCDFMDVIDNGNYTHTCRYFSTLGCGHKGLNSYFLERVVASLGKKDGQDMKCPFCQLGLIPGPPRSYRTFDEYMSKSKSVSMTRPTWECICEKSSHCFWDNNGETYIDNHFYYDGQTRVVTTLNLREASSFIESIKRT
jgi:hypothetical protein